MTRNQESETSEYVPIQDPASSNGQYEAERYTEADHEDDTPTHPTPTEQTG